MLLLTSWMWLIVACLFMIFLLRLRAPTMTGIPSPKKHWFLGNTIEFVQEYETMQDLLTKYSQQFKRTFAVSLIRIGFINNGALILVSPASVQHILKDNFKNYIKGPNANDLLEEFLGTGIFNSDGPRWKLHRKVAAQMFSRKLLQRSAGVAFEQAKKLLIHVEAHAKAGTPFDLQRMFYAFTMDTFCYIAFGVDLNSQAADHAFSRSFDSVQCICNNRGGDPFWKLRRLFRCSEERALTEGVQVMKTFAKSIIDAKRRTLAAGEQLLGPDLISRFLTRAQRDKTHVTDQELIDLVLNFIIAGRDTTAAGLSWTMFELLQPAQRGAATRRLVAEVVEKTGGSDGKRIYLDELPPTESFRIVYGGLPFTKAVIMEGLRLHPSVPKDTKFAVHDDVLPDGTQVKAGNCIIYCPYAMGRNPSLWPNPLSFKPDRWIKGAKAEEGQDQQDGAVRKSGGGGSLFQTGGVSDYMYPVFNAGPRVCIGRPLALMEMQLMLAVLLPRFTFSPAAPLDGTYVQTLVPPLKAGLLVRAHSR